MIRDGAILMVHCDHGTHAHWTLPGGGLEADETPEDAVIRELREEAGLEGRNPVLLWQRPYGREQAGDVERCFLVDVAQDAEPRLGHDPELDKGNQELTAVAWRPLSELGDDIQVSRVLAALARQS